MQVRTPWIFGVGAGFYDVITDQPVWHEHCRSMAALVPGARVLDLGIGPGVSGIEMARAMPRTTFVGVDLSAEMLGRAHRNARENGITVPLVRADVASLPFATGAFDGATAHSFFYLLGDSETALRETHRVVRAGGRVAFLEPGSGLKPLARLRVLARSITTDFRFGVSMILWTLFSGLHGRWTAESLAAALSSAGFDDVHVQPTLAGLGLLATAVRR